MKSNLLLCFGHKKGKSRVERTNLKRITLKKSESLFHEELIAPFTLNLKATLYLVSLYKQCNRRELLFLKQKEQKSEFLLSVSYYLVLLFLLSVSYYLVLPFLPLSVLLSCSTIPSSLCPTILFYHSFLSVSYYLVLHFLPF